MVTNVITWGLYALVMVAANIFPHPLWVWFKAPLAFFIFFYLVGANLTWLMVQWRRRPLSWSMWLAVSLANSLFLAPVFIYAAYQFFGQIRATTTILTYLLISLLPQLWSLLAILTKKLPAPIKVIRANEGQTSKRDWYPLIITVVFIGGIIAANSALYSFLPAPDTYSWLITLRQTAASGRLTNPLELARPLYTLFFISYHYLSSIPLITLSKYVFPFLFVLSVPAVWLLAIHLRRPVWRYLLLLSVLISPVTLFESLIVRQQLLAVVFFYYVVALSINAYWQYQADWLYLLLIYGAVGTVYHPFFLLGFIAMALALVLTHRHWILNHWQYGLLFVFLAYPWLEKLQVRQLANNAFVLTRAAWRNFSAGRWNFWFPAHYSNVDNYAMGWPGILGVIKYYGFYAGPLAVTLVALTLVYLFKSKSYRKQWQSFVFNAYLLPLWLMAGLLLVIAEVMPRLASLAYLPDRAWQINIAFYILLLLPLLLFWDKKWEPNWWPAALITSAIVLNIVGASYVNYLHRFTVPNYELRAAAWMKDNLLPGRWVAAASSKNLVRFLTNSTFVYLERDEFADPDPENFIAHLLARLDVTVKEINDPSLAKLPAVLIKEKTAVALTPAAEAGDEKLRLAAVSCSPAELEELIEQTRIKCAGQLPLSQTKPSLEAFNKPLYLYYARSHKLNPYRDRPYKASFTGQFNDTSFPGLDGQPNIFKPVYRDGDLVRIWRVDLKQVRALVAEKNSDKHDR